MSALFPAGPDAFGADELLYLRRETPAWGSYAHFAHGSASLPPQALYDALDRWLEAERRWGVQRAAEHFAEPLLAVRDSVARVLGTQPRHIALLDCASRAWSVAFAAALAAHPRIRAISSFDEYGSNSLCLLAARQQRGLELRLIDARGDAAQLLQRLDEQLHDLDPGQTPLLSLSAVPTGHGAATALEGVAERIRAHDGLFFLDASHAVGQLPLAVEAIGCDVLVFPPRKWLRGPKGLGVLYLGERALERLALPDGLDVGGAQWSDAFALQARDDARRFECSEFNPGLRLALKASCDYLLQTDVRRIARRNRQLRERIAQQLYRRLGWTPLEQGPHASALMTYAAPELSGEQWLKRLHARGVNASYIGPQSARWALREQALPGVLRLTPHYLTDDGEIERLGEALEDCLRQRAAS
ncbi:aminotransferase class V-fold PLP-dependent enzyme [Pseudomonas paraeruginosa]|uniref:aminotransferase class V-fold PLP-dependent enzyme n=1 Tax=Pseudomonas paraeruginosa TaxID=2994495 RepID=UPI00053D0A89|nr:aminotransferase class V-fold PLP-dependent enzyme [Pseudomonas paraeruginosa]